MESTHNSRYSHAGLVIWPLLIFVFVLVSIGVFADQAIGLWVANTRIDVGGTGIYFRALKEALLITLLAGLIATAFVREERNMHVAVGLTLAWLVLSIALTLSAVHDGHTVWWKGLGAGVRPLLPIFLGIGVYLSYGTRRRLRSESAEAFAGALYKACVVLLLFNLLIGGVQVVTQSGAPWATTIVGPRIHGWFPHYNSFAANMAGLLAVSMTLAPQTRRRTCTVLAYSTLVVVLASGSRGGLVACLFLIVAWHSAAYRSLLRVFLVASLVGACLFASVFYGAFTGRDIETSTYNRYAAMTSSVSQLDTARNVLFGERIGAGTNTSRTLSVAEADNLPNPHNQILTLLLSNGVLGVGLAAITVLWLAWNSTPKAALFCGGALFVLGLPYLILEFYPAAYALLAGLAIGGRDG